MLEMVVSRRDIRCSTRAIITNTNINININIAIYQKPVSRGLKLNAIKFIDVYTMYQIYHES